MLNVWFWQRIVSPHMAGFAVALVQRGCAVTYVAEQPMSPDRVKLGWTAPLLPCVDLIYVDRQRAVDALVRKAPAEAIHICQGVRANGLVETAQRVLTERGSRQWVVMETVNDAIWYGPIKRTEYSRLFHAKRASLQGVLATGHRTPAWVSARGMPADCVFPFAYFLADNKLAHAKQRDPGPYRFIFVGQLIPRKRVDWLIKALASLKGKSFELWVVGDGAEQSTLTTLGATVLRDQVRWLGQLPLAQVPAVMEKADCLVLPSVHDGWGAVASEALMAGTPVVCSDACGVAGAVQASGRGGVFPADDRKALTRLLDSQLGLGVVTAEARVQLAEWATCLGADAGARYLMQILEYKANPTGVRPVPPWSTGGVQCAA